MNQTEVSILLEILDLEYLKPILIDRFRNIDDLIGINLQEIGIQNPNDLNKLRYALDEIQQNKKSLEQLDPILTIDDSRNLITRIENETNLVTSSLNLLLNNQQSSHLSRDDATSDMDYSLYNDEIEQIELDVDRLQTNAEKLIERIQKQYPCVQDKQNQESPQEESSQSNELIKRTLVILALSVVSIGLVFYIKRK